MPELPEVETIRRGLAGRLTGSRIVAVEVRDPRLRLPVRERDLRALLGARLVAFDRRAKYLLVRTDLGRTIIIHLGMSGRMVSADPSDSLQRHDHVVWRLRLNGGAGEDLRFRDPRRFGLVVTARTGGLPRHPLLRRLGPEPLSDGFDAATLVRSAARRRVAVKAFLMDPAVVVGIGNIYASEVLWRAGVHPRRRADRIAPVRWERIREACVQVLSEAIAAGGTTLRDYRNADGALGTFAVALSVYDRAGRPCRRCATAIRRTVDGGRATYYCARCQR